MHRPTDRGDLSPVVRSTIASTNLLRTLCDLGALVPGGVPSAVEASITSGAVTPRVLKAMVERHSERGRAGVGPLRAALTAWPLHDKPGDSVLEPRMASLLARHRLPTAAFHARIGDFEVDFWLIDTPIVLECDGWDYHGRTKPQYAKDRDRDAELGTLGYLTFRFTWWQITRRAAHTARRIEALVERWSPDVLARHRAVEGRRR